MIACRQYTCSPVLPRLMSAYYRWKLVEVTTQDQLYSPERLL